jgi:hypothetical protein
MRNNMQNEGNLDCDIIKNKDADEIEEKFLNLQNWEKDVQKREKEIALKEINFKEILQG